ncbi:PEP-CTERM sorting domain-containing protein [Thalassotalea mangrovi]|uniref:PEP-CTERM sorting domain-containing protein n=1 Tax=Thalassotalea mangrovi TaxID=2572245 RepID=A0A4U1B6N4_9GAMM|nr:PEP-CTERM sorting domain-containing protein [Thalassotalea mangrovi]TKB46118.1 PEP-CTERM sorting domain-containing protein [Thalassotalea mangrovi]
MSKLATLLKVTLLSTILSVPFMANAELIKLLDFTETKPKDEGAVPGVFTFENLAGIEGFSVTFTTNTGADHWLDAGSGLGICPLDDCNSNPEDNINVGEGLTFEFTLDGEPYVVVDFTMLFVGHDNEGGISDSILLLQDISERSITNATPTTQYSVDRDTYYFVVVSGEVYLGSIWIDDSAVPPEAVPEPGNILLFLTAIAGLIGSRKLKSNK